MKIDFDGYAIGGLAVGESQKEMFEVLDHVWFMFYIFFHFRNSISFGDFLLNFVYEYITLEDF